jgi:hypothetical protein
MDFMIPNKPRRQPRSKRARVQIPPLPISLPALGLLVQTFVFWQVTGAIAWTWREPIHMWVAGPGNNDYVAYLSLMEPLWRIHVLWAILMAMTFCRELYFQRPRFCAWPRLRRTRLACDGFALALALWMVFASHLQLNTLPDFASGESPLLIHEFRFDPASQKWWLR